MGAFSGCLSPEKKKEKEVKERKAMDPSGPRTAEMSQDVAFQSFLGRLRSAVAKRDRVALAGMMAPNFGYRWDPAMSGETPMEYWDQNNLWPELENVLSQTFVTKDGYLISPPAFVANPEGYSGFRAGIRFYSVGWRFVYFIGGQDPLPG